jgi:hypothetical protein
VAARVAELVTAVLEIVRLEAFVRFGQIAIAVAVYIERRAVEHQPDPLVALGPEDQERVPGLVLVLRFLGKKRGRESFSLTLGWSWNRLRLCLDGHAMPLGGMCTTS